MSCPSAPEAYRTHHASNAGYGGSLITALEQLVYNYGTTPEKIFIIPFGQVFIFSLCPSPSLYIPSYTFIFIIPSLTIILGYGTIRLVVRMR